MHHVLLTSYRVIWVDFRLIQGPHFCTSDLFKALTFVRLISWLIKKWVVFRCAPVFWVLYFYGGLGRGGRKDVLQTNREPTNIQLLEDAGEFQVLIQAFSHDVLCFRASQ